MQHKPRIYCSGITEKQLTLSPGFLQCWNLQFEQDDHADITLQFVSNEISVSGIEEKFPLDTNLSDVLDEILPLDLSYVEQLFDIKEEQVDMIQLVRKELAQNLDELQDAMIANDGKQIKYFAHKLTSKLLVLSIPAIDASRFIEAHALDAERDAVQKNYHLLKMYCLIRLWQIQAV